jgi:drug/metabolite transporter (DMT)-like permease
MRGKWLSYAGLTLVAAIWGTNFGVSRAGMDTFDPVLFAFLRFGGAVPFFFLILKLREGAVGIPWRDALKLAGIGLFGVTTLEIAVMYSIKYTTLANASLLNVAPWPIFAALFASFITKEGVSRRLVIGGSTAIVGVCFIILGGGEGLSLSSDDMIGNLLAFGISIVGAVYNVICMPLMRRYSSLRVSTWIVFFGAAFMFPLTIGSWSKVDWRSLNGSNYTAILFNVFICTVFAFVVWNASMFRVGAARANFFRYVVPAAAVVAGYLFFDERVGTWQIVGAVFMGAGLVWISLEKPRHANLVPTVVSYESQ